MSEISRDEPVLVEILRGGTVESWHHGAAVVVDSAGKVLLRWGDIERPVFGRSAVKPLQALPLIESGAADYWQLGDTELALACGSHHGEAAHVSAVEAWLARMELGPGDLECGAHPPIDPAAAANLIRRETAASPLHNNCSGKHSGFLATARHLGEPTKGYIAPDHPVQRRVLAALEGMTGLHHLEHAPRGTDGCGIPVIGLPLAGLARAMARVADPSDLAPHRATAVQRLSNAMAAAPLMISGSTGFATALLRAAGDQVRAKPGAEGVYCAALPRLGLGIALKIWDGAQRAGEVALGAILHRLGALDPAAAAVLASRLHPPIRSIAGAAVGEIRAAAALHA